MSILPLSRALQKSCVLARHGLHIVLQYSSQYSYSLTLAVIISRMWACQSCKDLLPHIQFDWTVKVLDCTSALSWRLISEIPLPHFCSVLTAKDLMFRFRISALPWLPKIWSSTSTLSFCIDCQKCELPLQHFRSAFTAKYVKFCSRASSLPWLAKIWSSALHTCSARTSKDVKFRFRISSLPGLPKMCSLASAFSLSLDCQRSEDRILH